MANTLIEVPKFLLARKSMDEEAFQDIFGELFTKEEWGLWVKSKFNLFDNYVERVGMSKEDADRLRNGKPVKKPLTLPKNLRKLKIYENNNTPSS